MTTASAIGRMGSTAYDIGFVDGIDAVTTPADTATRQLYAMRLAAQREGQRIYNMAAKATTGAQGLYQRMTQIPYLGRVVGWFGSAARWVADRFAGVINFAGKIGFGKLAVLALSTGLGRRLIKRTVNVTTYPIRWTISKTLDGLEWALSKCGNPGLLAAGFIATTRASVNSTVSSAYRRTLDRLHPVIGLNSMTMQVTRTISKAMVLWQLASMTGPFAPLAQFGVVLYIAAPLVYKAYAWSALRQVAKDTATVPAAVVKDASQAGQAVGNVIGKIGDEVTRASGPTIPTVPTTSMPDPTNRAEHRATGGQGGRTTPKAAR